jgi:hypothetical protein
MLYFEKIREKKTEAKKLVLLAIFEVPVCMYVSCLEMLADFGWDILQSFAGYNLQELVETTCRN